MVEKNTKLCFSADIEDPAKVLVIFDKNVGEVPGMIYLGKVIEGTEPKLDFDKF